MGYSREYFKPNFGSLGQLVSILWVFFVEKVTFLVKKAIFVAFEHPFWQFLLLIFISLNVFDVLKALMVRNKS